MKATCALCSVSWLTILCGSLVSLGILWLTRIPLGIPGEWTWNRAIPESDLQWNLVGGAIAAALFAAYVVLGWQRLEALSAAPSRRLEIASWLLGLVVVSFVWLWIVQEVAPLQNRLGKSGFVLYYPSSSGYFTRARYKSPHPTELLSGYEDLMREGDVLHTGTHPPGLFLVFHGLIAACETSPQLCAFLDATQAASFRESCDIIASNNLRRAVPQSFLPQDRQVLWLATLLVMLSASLTVVPLFGLLCRNVSISSAWVCAALWPGIPAVAIFIPKSDVVFPLIGVTLMWVWLTAWDRRSLILSLLSGMIAWCGLICSLAFLPVFLATGILTLGNLWWRANSERGLMSEDNGLNSIAKVGTKHWPCISAAIMGFAIPTFALWRLARMNLLNVWWLNYRNHAGFYQQFNRTYWKWLAVNPIELAFAVGFPVALLGLIACGRCLNQTHREKKLTARLEQRIVVVSVVIVWGLLWLTGKNSGEAARLWILLMPWLIWLASIQFDAMLSLTEQFNSRRQQVIALLAIQFTICLLTVARVCGFHGDII